MKSSRTTRWAFAAAMAATALLEAPGAAAVPATLTYQGRLYDDRSEPQTGTLPVTFKLHDAAQGGHEVWSEQLSVTFDEGYFSVELGAASPFGAGVFDGSTRYFEVTLAGEPPLSPRAPVGSVPYALVAGDATGDLHPRTVSVGGKLVIDDQGQWVGPPVPGGGGGFTGTFSGPATFSGPSSFDGPVSFHGLDLFNAAMAGTYPAVDSAVNGGNYFCGAPQSFEVGTVTGPSAAYGSLVYTAEGSYFQAYNSQPANLSCQNMCYGPITFYLVNLAAAKTMVVNAYLDDGPGHVYVDGNNGPNGFRSPKVGGAASDVSVPIPAGAFALSFIACSNNGPTLWLKINDKFITGQGLAVDLDRTFHRNGR